LQWTHAYHDVAYFQHFGGGAQSLARRGKMVEVAV
jgi:hypothetical protein